MAGKKKATAKKKTTTKKKPSPADYSDMLAGAKQRAADERKILRDSRPKNQSFLRPDPGYNKSVTGVSGKKTTRGKVMDSLNKTNKNIKRFRAGAKNKK